MAGLSGHQNAGEMGSSHQANGLESSVTQSDRAAENVTMSEATDSQNGHEERAPSSSSSNVRQFQEEFVTTLVKEAKSIGAITIDLSHKNLTSIPPDLLECPSLEYLYLEGNRLTSLPENFFDCLPRLKWLDLRQNYLQAIPTTYIGRHQHLRNLLLEGNELRTLPLELGLIPTLNGLNLSNNPLEFPPMEVIERGTQTVLAFLKELLKAKSMGKIPPESGIMGHHLGENGMPRLEDLRMNDSADNSDSEDEWGAKGYQKLNRQNSMNKSSADMSRRGSSSKDSRSHVDDQYDDLVGPVPQSLSLHKPTTYDEIKKIRKEKLIQAGALGSPPQQRREKHAKQQHQQQQYQSQQSMQANRRHNEIPDDEKLHQKYVDERRLARLKEMKEKQDMILQRRKDQNALKEFRDQSKVLQQRKNIEKMTRGKLEYPEAAEEAPFGIDQEHMKVMSNKERIAEDVKAKHEKLRKNNPAAKQKLEQERAQRDKELDKRIKAHTTAMQERRKQPKGNPQEEMAAAKQELALAEQLQREIEKRKKELEYRFTAFTGDVVGYSSKSNGVNY